MSDSNSCTFERAVETAKATSQDYPSCHVILTHSGHTKGRWKLLYKGKRKGEAGRVYKSVREGMTKGGIIWWTPDGGTEEWAIFNKTHAK